MVNVRKLKRKLQRLKAQMEKLEAEHDGKQATGYNYYGGFSLGYLVGKVSLLEDILDEIEEFK